MSVKSGNAALFGLPHWDQSVSLWQLHCRAACRGPYQQTCCDRIRNPKSMFVSWWSTGFLLHACIYRHLYGFVLSSQSNIRNCITSRRKGLYITCGTFRAARKSERQEGHICYNIDIPESHVRYLYPIGSYVISLQWVLSDCIMLCPNISQCSPHAWHVQRPFMAIKCGQRPIL